MDTILHAKALIGEFPVTGKVDKIQFTMIRFKHVCEGIARNQVNISQLANFQTTARNCPEKKFAFWKIG
ncbi:MAG TPA: hypothetical protein PKE03_02710 [Bacteroidales bacterium]|nr:hypothetical protein [Bacteroidales bacterium]